MRVVSINFLPFYFFYSRRFINATDSTPKDLDVTLLFGKIGAKGEYNDWMLRETLNNNVDGLKVLKSRLIIGLISN